MKRLLLVSVFVLTIIPTYGQKLHLGASVYADANFYKYSTSMRFNNREDRMMLGGSFGLEAKYARGPLFSFNSGVLYSFKRYEPNTQFAWGAIRSVERNSIEIPLMVRYNLTRKAKSQWFVQAGCFMQRELSITSEIEYGPRADGEFQFWPSTYFFPTLRIGTELHLPDNKSIQLSTCYRKGIYGMFTLPWLDKLSFDLTYYFTSIELGKR